MTTQQKNNHNTLNYFNGKPIGLYVCIAGVLAHRLLIPKFIDDLIRGFYFSTVILILNANPIKFIGFLYKDPALGFLNIFQYGF